MFPLTHPTLEGVPMDRLRVSLVSVVLAIIASVSLVGFAPADIRLEPGYVTDASDVISNGEERAIDQRMQEVADRTGTNLVFVYVPSFDGAAPGDWAVETAALAGMGPRDVLIAIATQDRLYGYSVANDYPLTDAQLDRIAAEDIEPSLRRSDWAGAAFAAAGGFVRELAGDTVPADGIVPQAPSTSGGGIPFIPILIVVALVVGGYLLLKRARKGSSSGDIAGTDPAAQAAVPTEALITDANARLLNVDDAIQASVQEMGFAEAEFGAELVAPYKQSIEEAKKLVGDAYRIQQKLNDAYPEDEATRRTMAEEMTSLVDEADALLEAKADDFRSFRDLLGRLPEAIEGLQQRITAVAAALPGGVELLADIKNRYPETDLGDVHDDDVEATDLLAFARTMLSDGEKAVAAGEREEAAMAIRAGEDAILQAQRHLDAISEKSRALTELDERIKSEVADIESTAIALQSSTDDGARTAAAQALSLVAGVRKALGSSHDPDDLIGRLQGIAGSLSKITESVEKDRLARKQFELEYERTAEAIVAAERYISTRRGAVRTQARTSLVTAHDMLNSAARMADSNPEGATRELKRARDHAKRAQSLAQQDVQGFPDTEMARPFSRGFTGESNSDYGGDFAGALTKALMAGVLGHAGGSGSSSIPRGTSSSGLPDMGRLFGGGSSFSPRSFGGSGSRRSSGGGGGRRSSGGRF